MYQVTKEQPTLAAIPGILLRTSLRMVARIILLVAGVALLCTLALGFASLFVATWRSPRTPKIQALTALVLSVWEVYREWR